MTPGMTPAEVVPTVPPVRVGAAVKNSCPTLEPAAWPRFGAVTVMTAPALRAREEAVRLVVEVAEGVMIMLLLPALRVKAPMASAVLPVLPLPRTLRLVPAEPLRVTLPARVTVPVVLFELLRV